MRLVLLIAGIFMLNACAAEPSAPANGHALAEVIAKFEQGKTTYSDVVRELGEPATLDTGGDGIKIAHYGGVKVENNAATYIPIVSSFAAKSKVTGTTATLVFDKSDVLMMKDVKERK